MQYIQSAYNIVVKQNEESVYLYNSYSGAYAKLEKEVHAIVDNEIIDDKNPCPYFDELLKQGFIKPIELNEYNKILTTERSAIYDSSEEKLTFVIAPTLACNLNCVYCFEYGYRNKKTMSDETLYDVINFIQSKLNAQTKAIHITWFGGEPLLAFQTIVELNKMLMPIISDKEVKYTASMITNGILLTDDKAKYLAENCNIKNVQITIDGTEEVYCRQKGANSQQFNQVLHNIKTSLKYFKAAVRFNCGKNNYNDIVTIAKQIITKCDETKNLNLYLAKLVDYACSCDTNYYTQDEFDVKSLEFNKYVNQLLNREYKPKIPKYRKSFCGLIKLKNLVIGPDGEFYKCEHYVGRADKVIGNVKQGIFYTDELVNFLNNHMNDKCRRCKLFPLCIGGCPSQKRDLKGKDVCGLSLDYVKQILETYIKDS